MLKNILKVYDEDLAKGDLAQDAISSDKAVMAGATQGALCVNVFAVGSVSIASDVVVTVKDGAEKNGSFAEIMTIPVASGSFADGDLMATATLPIDVKDYVIASVASSASNSGGVRVTLGYLAR
jgi:hypothetical protein